MVSHLKVDLISYFQGQSFNYWSNGQMFIKTRCVKKTLSFSDYKLNNKLEKLTERVQAERRIISDLTREIDTFPREPTTAKRVQTTDDSDTHESDPDVWAPPTPLPDNRKQADMPAWARQQADSRKIYNFKYCTRVDTGKMRPTGSGS